MALYSQILQGGSGTLFLELNYGSQDFANNQTQVNYRLYARGNNGYGFWNLYKKGWTKITLDGSVVHHKTGLNFDLRGGKTQNLASGTATITHNSDGAKTFNFRAELWSTSAKGTITGTFTLPTIPRASSFTLTNQSGGQISQAYTGDTIKIKIDKANAGFSHTVRYSIEDSLGTIVTKSGSSEVSYTIPSSFLQSHLSDNDRLNMVIYVDTYNGSTLLGTAQRSLTVKAPEHLKPTIFGVGVRETNQKKISVVGLTPFIQNVSKIEVSFSVAGASGSRVVSTTARLGNQTRTTRPAVFDRPNVSGDQTIVLTAIDSRGRSYTFNQRITIDAYTPPSVNVFGVSRSRTSDLVANARISASHTPINKGYRNINGMDVVVESREKDGAKWTTRYSAKNNVATFNQSVGIGSDYNASKAYDIRLTVSDQFNSHTAIATLPAGALTLVLGADDPVVGIGKVPQRDKGLDVEDGARFGNIVEIKGDQQTKAIFSGTSDSGSLIRFYIDGRSEGWIGTWGDRIQLCEKNGKRLDFDKSNVRYGGTALADSGSNINGNWVKFYDGTLICYKKGLRLTYNASHELGINWYYPSAFFNDDVICLAIKDNYHIRHTSMGTFTHKNYAEVCLWGDLSGQFGEASNSHVSVMAIGRWK